MEAASSSETMVTCIKVHGIKIRKALAVWRFFLKYLYVWNRYEPTVWSVPNNGTSLRLQCMALQSSEQIHELENTCSAFFAVYFGIIRSLVTWQFYIHWYVLCFCTYLGSYDFEFCHQLGKYINRMSVTNGPTYTLPFLQDLDATTSLALKIKQEPFTASSGPVYGEYTECCRR